MKPVLLPLLLCALPALADAQSLRADPVDLMPPTVGQVEPPAALRHGLRFAGGLQLSLPEDVDFGGLSGMVAEDDGASLTTISDHGHWYRLRLNFDGDRLTGAELSESGRLRDPQGRPLMGRISDAEELMAIPGGYAVTFERRHRMWAYARLGEAARSLAVPEALRDLPDNGGIEAATSLPDGRLLLIAEQGASPRQAWVGQPGAWASLSYRPAEGFSPTGAAVHDGMLYVLERRFTLLGGPEARLVRLPLTEIRPGAVLDGDALGQLSLPLAVDNFEAIAVTGLSDSHIRLLILSDDNFQSFQRTLLLSFILPAEKP